MAKAIRIPPTIQDDIQLTLTMEEASALLWVLRKVGGSQKTPRAKINIIIDALDNIGVKQVEWLTSDLNSAVYFSDRKLG